MARGDHIYIEQTARGIPFQHHGIDLGDGTVIHLAPRDGARIAIRDESDQFTVRCDSMDDFCDGEPVHTVEHPDARNADEIVLAAQSQLGTTGYSLLNGNCEHFATFCATGRFESHQIEMSEATVKTMTSLATKVVWTMSRRAGAKYVMRGATRVHPATMLADGVELATLAIACRGGLSARDSSRLAKIGGTVAAAGVGGVVGGPAGAAVCVAAHASSGAIADQVCSIVKRWLR